MMYYIYIYVFLHFLILIITVYIDELYMSVVCKGGGVRYH